MKEIGSREEEVNKLRRISCRRETRTGSELMGESNGGKRSGDNLLKRQEDRNGGRVGGEEREVDR